MRMIACSQCVARPAICAYCECNLPRRDRGPEPRGRRVRSRKNRKPTVKGWAQLADCGCGTTPFGERALALCGFATVESRGGPTIAFATVSANVGSRHAHAKLARIQKALDVCGRDERGSLDRGSRRTPRFIAGCTAERRAARHARQRVGQRTSVDAFTRPINRRTARTPCSSTSRSRPDSRPCGTPTPDRTSSSSWAVNSCSPITTAT